MDIGLGVNKMIIVSHESIEISLLPNRIHFWMKFLKLVSSKGL